MGTRAAGASVSTPLDYHLLVIGVDDYLDWPDLKSAVRDAQSVTAVLQSDYGFAAERTTSLYNAEATEANIVMALRRYAKSLDAGDALFIYYADHGQLDALTEEGAWVPVDGDRKNSSNWIWNSSIKRLLRATKARHILLVSDSCFAGDFFHGSRGAPPEITDAYVREAYGKNARQAMTSGGLEPVADAGFDGHSVFAYFLLKALEENESPYLVPSDLYQRIKGGVAANAPQQPILGLLAETGGEVGGEFVLFRQGAGGDLDDLIERKRASLSLLEQQESEAAEANAAQLSLARQKQAELDALDAKIEAMQNRLNTGDSSGGNLSDLLALIRQKETQARELAELERKRQAEEAAREAEIARLQAAEAAKRKIAFDQDQSDYEEILKSSYATEAIKLQAWVALCRAWQVKGVDLNKPGNLRWDPLKGRAVVGFGSGGDMDARRAEEARLAEEVKVLAGRGRLEAGYYDVSVHLKLPKKNSGVSVSIDLYIDGEPVWSTLTNEVDRVVYKAKLAPEVHAFSVRAEPRLYASKERRKDEEITITGKRQIQIRVNRFYLGDSVSKITIE